MDTSAGIVLCGGRSSRMGTDKAALPWAGQTLLEHMVATLSVFCEPVLVIHAQDQVLPALPERAVLVPDVHPHLGPLGGLHAALRYLEGRHELAFACPCDMPYLNREHAEQLAARLEGHDAATFELASGIQPLPGLYRTRILATVTNRLTGNDRSLRGLLSAINSVHVSATGSTATSEADRNLCGFNTMDEYIRLAAQANDGLQTMRQPIRG